MFNLPVENTAVVYSVWIDHYELNAILEVREISGNYYIPVSVFRN